ncbi:hypothetical protein SORBI_3002G224450 [Sorghum bicolor]|uniref:Uncharacterized protein n=1 Tax=Sorghum bicolor TaxID=4558 RepID=A0A1W0W5J0_SORBI|nr:hypothetical protein SORBI_3002G224450 [Sorghum bicolor]
MRYLFRLFLRARASPRLARRAPSTDTRRPPPRASARASPRPPRAVSRHAPSAAERTRRPPSALRPAAIHWRPLAPEVADIDLHHQAYYPTARHRRPLVPQHPRHPTPRRRASGPPRWRPSPPPDTAACYSSRHLEQVGASPLIGWW